MAAAAAAVDPAVKASALWTSADGKGQRVRVGCRVRIITNLEKNMRMKDLSTVNQIAGKHFLPLTVGYRDICM